ncbi:hypothetical protein IQ230_08035 [Gloeocapsopsis crepidinum LEGE 06123]|uniref:Uncharacterized protein n=1 Tax=Gloeocapsopsis crepidinum LEGE 06123 TaxID=588587 RepID=A0ABR9UPU9_9CHRO|nr:hypothetical protein [Gloeocapsopsis crepidinum]MBE9190309.1 hypothetical protein [Gloeocapsopsis crepidinum LEGE 06123]
MGICSATTSPSSTLADTNQSVNTVSGTSTARLGEAQRQKPSPWNDSQKTLYAAGVQVKFLHLEAEVESLLQQLQAIKKQRHTAAEEVSVK